MACYQSREPAFGCRDAHAGIPGQIREVEHLCGMGRAKFQETRKRVKIPDVQNLPDVPFQVRLYITGAPDLFIHLGIGAQFRIGPSDQPVDERNSFHFCSRGHEFGGIKKILQYGIHTPLGWKTSGFRNGKREKCQHRDPPRQGL